MPPPTRTNVDAVPWGDLLTKIRQKECVPFIGAGASFPTLPLAAKLAEVLLTQDERESNSLCPLADRAHLEKVCQYLAVRHADSSWPKRRIADYLANSGQPDFDDPGEPHRVLASLRLPVYVTTNYDDFMMQALRRMPGVRPKQEFARWTTALLNDESSLFDTDWRPTPEEPVVFHLHGHTGLYQSMVASEDDYLDFLVNISKEISRTPRDSSERTMLPLPIRRAIRYNRLLFIGYGLADINFRVILRSLVGSLEQSARQLHLSIQHSGDRPGAEELENYLEEYFRWTLQLNVFWGSSRDFCGELVRRWAQ